MRRQPEPPTCGHADCLDSWIVGNRPGHVPVTGPVWPCLLDAELRAVGAAIVHCAKCGERWPCQQYRDRERYAYAPIASLGHSPRSTP